MGILGVRNKLTDCREMQKRGAKMKRKIIGKTIITLLTALIFVLVPVIRPDQPVKAAGDGAVPVLSGSVEDTTDDWNVMVERLGQAIQNGTGQNVSFQVGNHFEIPADILSRLAGRNATLEIGRAHV